jgi:hypothetical protein
MNAAEIADAVDELFSTPLDPAEFPYAFLQAFGNKETTLRKLRTGDTNKSDVGGVLQRNNIHLAVASAGQVTEALVALRESPATARHKVKFILATDGDRIEAEELGGGSPLECAWRELPEHLGFFLPLAGISTVKEIRENAFDIRATAKLNRLYVELLRENTEWGTDERRPELNHFLARLIFSFFAEDTGIFAEEGLFTKTVLQMSERDSSNTDMVIGTIFQAMNTRHAEREASGLPRWATKFPYVNGGLFSGDLAVPRLTRTARSYLLQVGSLDWKRINPDIFGSMIQAVADDEERGALGMHYTSVPNILKVLNPLFLDDLRGKLEEAGDNARKLLNLRNRIKRIRVFDPACGSGNFLVIAYKEMRAVEAEVNRRRGEPGRSTEIPLTNFRGIELRDFAAEIARLALVIAEFQSDVLYRGQQEALNDFLPLDAENWITSGDALLIDWLAICPPSGTHVSLITDGLFSAPRDQPEVDFDNAGGETYICGNPPYRGSKWQTVEQKAALANAWSNHPKLAKTTDLVTGWFARFLDYSDRVPDATAAFVATNSVCQGQQAVEVWPVAFERGCEIRFAHISFKWANLASFNAGVTVVIVGLGRASSLPKRLYQESSVRQCTAIGPYLVPDSVAYVTKAQSPISEQGVMLFGNMPRDGGHLFLDSALAARVAREDPVAEPFIKRFVGSDELINGRLRFCLWIEEDDADAAQASAFIAERLQRVAANRRESDAASTRSFAEKSHRFVQIAGVAQRTVIVVPRVSSENRPYLPVDYLTARFVVGDRNFALYDAPLWNMALIASRLHWVWIGTVCVRMRTDFSYSNTLGWNTFPVPPLTEQNKAELTRCAEGILLAREAHYPATIADLYDPAKMPDSLREAHERNDEVLERIYIGRRFRNDTERLERLFEMYAKMTANPQRPTRVRGRRQTG